MVNNKDGYKMDENCFIDKQGKGQIEGKVMLAKNSDEEQMRTSSRKWKEKGELKKEMNRKWLRRGGKWPKNLE